MRFPLFMSRPGKFTAKITATDKVTNKIRDLRVAGHRSLPGPTDASTHRVCSRGIADIRE